MYKFTSVIAASLLLMSTSGLVVAMPYKGNIDPTWKESQSWKISNPYTTDGPREKCEKLHKEKGTGAGIRWCSGQPSGNNFDWMD